MDTDGGSLRERPTWARVDLPALRANLAELGRRAEGRAVFAVVKADAYGHGAVPVARALVGVGCEKLVVLSLEEGAELRDAGIEAPILVLGGVHEEPELAVARGLTPVVHHRAHVRELAHAARASGRRLPVHVEVDTGMRRMGVPLAEAEPLVAAAAEAPELELEGLFTHLARADSTDLEPSLDQLSRFRELVLRLRARGVAPRWVHAANSAGVLVGKPLFEALPEANAVRPGLSLYGVLPAPHLQASLGPVMTLLTRVVHVRDVEAGAPVGYGATWRAERATRIATLPVGYADGVPVSATNCGQVLLRGRRLLLVGRVSMDYVTVDVGDAPVRPGDDAVVFGASSDDALPVEEAAAAAGTIPYELLVRVGARVPRVHRP